VGLIRKRNSAEVPILLCADSAFTDQKAYEIFEEEFQINFITTGKLYADVKGYVGQLPNESFSMMSKNRALRRFTEFAGKLKSWKKFRRCIFTTLQCGEDRQPVKKMKSCRQLGGGGVAASKLIFIMKMKE